MKLLKKSILFFTLVVNLPIVYAVSFDCNKASRLFEKSICSNSELSILDDELAIAYKTAVSANPEIKISQRDWIKKSRLCESDPSIIDKCIKNAYKDRIATLKNERNPSQAQASPSDVRVNSIPQDAIVQKNIAVIEKDLPTQKLNSVTQTEKSGDGRLIKTVIVDGIGSDIPSAAQNAAQNALTEIVGSFMDANKILDKKIEIRDGIRTQTSKISTDIKEYSQGTIKSFEVIDAKNQSGLTRVTARVSVRVDDFRVYVKKLAEGEVNVSAGLFATMNTEKKQINNLSGLLADNIFLPIINGQALDIKVSAPQSYIQFESKDKLTSIASQYINQLKKQHAISNIVTFDVEISMKSDFIENMLATLAATTADSTTNQISQIKETCDRFLKSNENDDFCFFIKENENSPQYVKTFLSKNASREISKLLKLFGQKNYFGLYDRDSLIPKLEISFIDSSGNKLQSEYVEVGGNSNMAISRNFLIYNKNSDNSVAFDTPPAYSLFGIRNGKVGIVKRKTIGVVMAVTENTLKNSNKIIVKYVQ